MSDHIVHTSDETFENDVLQSSKPVLVDFWAEWCGPCKMIAPMLDQVSEEFSEQVTVAKLDIEHNQVVPGKFAVRAVPTLILFKGGAVQAQHIGGLSKTQLTAFLEANL